METGVEIDVLCVFLWLLWPVSCGSCGGFLWFLWWWFLGDSCCDWSCGCNVWWVFGPFRYGWWVFIRVLVQV